MAAYLNPKSITETYQKVHESGIADFLNGSVHAFTYVPERQKGGHFWKPAPSVRMTAQTSQEIVTAAISKYWQTRFDTSLSRADLQSILDDSLPGKCKSFEDLLRANSLVQWKSGVSFQFRLQTLPGWNEM